MADPTQPERRQPQPVSLASAGEPHRPFTPLPAPLTSFVGREREIAAVIELLHQPGVRFVTITGPGGAGKTRLALRVAHVLQPEHRDGVVFVDLESIASTSMVPAAIVRALGLRESTDRPVLDRLTDALARRQVLLLLDNCEHVAAALHIVAQLLAACPALTVIATSRLLLRVSGEHDYPVPSLDAALPPAGLHTRAPDAIELFAVRSRTVDHSFALTAENEAVVAAICERVDGLPLAIELAAAKTRLLTLPELLVRLDRRLPLLASGAHDRSPRSRSLPEAIAWSYDLLDEEARSLFRQLAVFAGSFTLEAALAVNGTGRVDEPDSLATCETLLDHSLLRRLAPVASAARFSMLETIREYALIQLAHSGEEELARERHARYFLELAERADPAIWGGSDQSRWLDCLDAELPNVRAALSWFESRGDGERHIRLAAAMGGLWQFRSHRVEGRAHLRRALELADEEDSAARAMALLKLGILERNIAVDEAGAKIAEAVAIRRRLGNLRRVAHALTSLGIVHLQRDELDLAETTFLEAGGLMEREGDLAGLADVRHMLARTALEQGQTQHAQKLATDALTLFRGSGFDYGTAYTLLTLAELAMRRGELAAAAGFVRESLRLWSELANEEGATDAVMAAGMLALRGRKPVEGFRLVAAATARGDALDHFPPVRERQRHAGIIAAARSQTDDTTFSAAWSDGEALPWNDAFDEAMRTLRCLAHPTAPMPAPADAIKLTPRELDVLRLVVDGLSDREIATALGLSYRTITSYVRNILTKLDVTSRTAAATQAIRHGLM